MNVVKINWSGGKDSTASVILHINEGDKCIVVCYIPMLTIDIPLIAKASEIGKLITDYPKAREILINLDKDSEIYFHRGQIKDNKGVMNYPYRNYKTFTDRINEFERGVTNA